MSNGNDETAPPAPSPRVTSPSDWAPWIVLMGLLTFGFAGTFGLVPISVSRATSSSPHPNEVVAPRQGTASPEPAAAPRPTAANSAKPAPEAVTVRHVLVQHKRAWRVDHEVMLTVEQAKERADEARRKLLEGVDFYKVLGDYSNSREVVDERGVLPRLKRGDGMPGIGEAAFALKVGGVSEVVQTPFGFHVLQRTE